MIAKPFHIALTLVVAGLMSASTAVAADWGTLTGKFVYDGAPPTPAKLSVTKDVEVCGQHPLVDESLLVDADGGIANVVIYVRDAKVDVHPDYDATANDEVLLDNKNCRFEPHVLPIRLTQTLVMANADPVGHNSNVQPLGDAGANPLIAAGGKATHKFNRKQSLPVPVTCNIHPWMKAYVLPRDNPYTAVSAEDGTFTIENLPAGKDIEFQVWHETAGYVDTPKWSKGRFKMKLKPGDNDLGTIKLDPKLFKK